MCPLSRILVFCRGPMVKDVAGSRQPKKSTSAAGGFCLNEHVMVVSAGETEIKEMTREQAADENNFRDKDTKGELEVQEKMPLLEWLANSYKKFGYATYVLPSRDHSATCICSQISVHFGLLWWHCSPLQKALGCTLPVLLVVRCYLSVRVL